MDDEKLKIGQVNGEQRTEESHPEHSWTCNPGKWVGPEALPQPGDQQGDVTECTSQANRDYSKQLGVWAALDRIAVPHRTAQGARMGDFDIREIYRRSQAEYGQHPDGENH